MTSHSEGEWELIECPQLPVCGSEGDWELIESHQRPIYGYDNQYGHDVRSLPNESYQSLEYDCVAYPWIPMENTSIRENFPYPCTFQSLEHVWTPMQRDLYNPNGGTCNIIEAPAPAAEDPEMRIVLDFFKDLYIESQDLFKKLHSRLEDAFSVKKFTTAGQEDLRLESFSAFFKKLPTMLLQLNSNQMKVGTMQRSLSLGSPRNQLKPELFKVRTFYLGGGGVQQDGQGDSDTKVEQYYRASAEEDKRRG